MLDDAGLDLIFRKARTHGAWADVPVDDALLRQIYELAKLGPTGANSSPLRVVFVKTKEAKERLRPCLSPGNVDKTMAAPVCAILAYDLRFYERMDYLFPHNPTARSWFEGKPTAERSAFQNATLQSAYFMIAARALGLDCGPMGGFDNEMLDREFFPDERIKSNLLCNLGHGIDEKLLPRLPRLPFDEACRIV